MKFKISETPSVILKSFIALSSTMFLLNQVNNINVYEPIDEKKIDQMKNVIPTKKLYDDLFKDIKDSNQNNVVVVLDSVNNIKHAKNVKGIIDNKIKNNDEVKSFYLPLLLAYDIDKEYMKSFEASYPDVELPSSNQKKIIEKDLKEYDDLDNEKYLYKELSDISKDKKVYINESFSHVIQYNKNYDFEHDTRSLSYFGDVFNRIEQEAKEQIKYLNENENIFISKSAGNNAYLKKNHIIDTDMLKLNNLLKEKYDILTNNNYKQIKEISTMVTDMFEVYRIDKEKGLEIIDNFKKTFEVLFSTKGIDFNEFLSLSIKDYLTNFNAYALLKESHNLKHDNLRIVETITETKVLENYEVYKKYNNGKEIKEIEDYFGISKYFYFGSNYDLNPQQVERFKTFVKENQDKYPEIFKLNEFNSFSSLRFNDSKIVDLNISNQDGIGFSALEGTSFSTPEYLGDKILEDIKLKEFEKNKNIEISI